MTENASTPSVLFVCVKNGGKSQMAAGLMRKIAGDAVQVYSAGTKPGSAINDLSVEALAEVVVDITGSTPRGQTLFPSSSQFAATFLLGCTRGGSAGIFGVPSAPWPCSPATMQVTLLCHAGGYRARTRPI